MLEFMNNIGEVSTVYTLVDFYQYIKGVEYLICVAFFCCFPAFYRYINKSDEAGADKVHH
jgi:hypothetical protein